LALKRRLRLQGEVMVSGQLQDVGMKTHQIAEDHAFRLSCKHSVGAPWSGAPLGVFVG
jgi:hypothetical protein